MKNIPLNVKIIMAISAIFMPIFLIIPFFIWQNQNSEDYADLEMQKARLKPVGELRLSSETAQTAKAEPKPFSVEETYEKVCAACHKTGISGSPIFGDTAAWNAKIQELGGLDKTIETAFKGKGAMLPKGGATNLSDEEFRQIVLYMLNAVRSEE